MTIYNKLVELAKQAKNKDEYISLVYGSDIPKDLVRTETIEKAWENKENIKSYEVSVDARITSNLSQEELEKVLVIALHNVNTGYTKLDNVDNNLQVIEYTRASAFHLKEV